MSCLTLSDSVQASNPLSTRSADQNHNDRDGVKRERMERQRIALLKRSGLFGGDTPGRVSNVR